MADFVLHRHADAAMQLDRLLPDDRPSGRSALWRAEIALRLRVAASSSPPSSSRASPCSALARARSAYRRRDAAAPGKRRSATPNCLRVFRYSTVISCIAAMAPTASAQSAAIAWSATRSINGQRVAGLAEAASAGTATLASVISAARRPSMRRIAAPRHAVRLGVDQKQADAVAVGLLAGDARARRSACRRSRRAARGSSRRRARNRRRLSWRAWSRRRRDRSAPAVSACAKASCQLAGRDLRQELALLRIAAAVAQEAAAQHDSGEIRLEHKRAAERFHDDHGLDRAAADAAVLFGKRHAEQAKLGDIASTFSRLQPLSPWRVMSCAARNRNGRVMQRSTLSFRSRCSSVKSKSILFVVLMLSSASRKGARLEAPCICTSFETRCFAALVRMRLLGVLQPQDRLRDDVLLNLVRAAVDRDLARS